MRKKEITLGAAILLSACNSGYFDQHPANVRPESEAVAVVLARQQPRAVAESGPVTSAPSARVAEGVLPPATPGGRVSSPMRSMPSPPSPPMPPPMSGTTTAVTLPKTASVPSAETVRPVMVQAEPPPPTAQQPPPAPSTIESQPVPDQAAPNPSPPSQAASPPPSQAAPAVAMQAVPQTPAAPDLAASPPAAQPVPAAPHARCEAVAAQRAADAAANGLDRETQEIVRRGAFTDCVAWDTLHPGAPP